MAADQSSTFGFAWAPACPVAISGAGLHAVLNHWFVNGKLAAV